MGTAVSPWQSRCAGSSAAITQALQMPGRAPGACSWAGELLFSVEAKGTGFEPGSLSNLPWDLRQISPFVPQFLHLYNEDKLVPVG